MTNTNISEPTSPLFPIGSFAPSKDNSDYYLNNPDIGEFIVEDSLSRKYFVHFLAKQDNVNLYLVVEAESTDEARAKLENGEMSPAQFFARKGSIYLALVSEEDLSVNISSIYYADLPKEYRLHEKYFCNYRKGKFIANLFEG
jgi:hypothetical protein